MGVFTVFTRSVSVSFGLDIKVDLFLAGFLVDGGVITMRELGRGGGVGGGNG